MLCRICQKNQAEASLFSGGSTVAVCAECAARSALSVHASAACPHCGKTLTEITRTGFCGCPECYRVFRDYLQPLFGKGELRHRGRVPAGERKAAYLERAQILAKEMEAAYACGDTDRVKRLTEELRSLKEGLSAENGEKKDRGGY